MRCKVCKVKFEPKYFNQKTCFDTKCIVQYGKEVKKKEWNKEKKARKEKLKSNSDHIQELQKIFNTFIRLRDKDKPCISCGKQLGSKFDAGHYRSAGGNPELRFNEFNVHAQCVYCNQHLHGNLIDYRKGLIKRIGVDMVEWLEGPHDANKLSIPEIKDLKEYYSKQIKELKK